MLYKNTSDVIEYRTCFGKTHAIFSATDNRLFTKDIYMYIVIYIYVYNVLCNREFLRVLVTSSKSLYTNME